MDSRTDSGADTAMMAPLPLTSLPADRPELPRVRFDVRLGSGRSVTYELGGDEFLIGGATGCDLRIPAPDLPPVICQFLRKPEGVWVRRLTPLLPVALNEVPLSASNLTRIHSGDKLTVAGIAVAITIASQLAITPHFVPLEEESSNSEPAPIPSHVPPKTDELLKLEEQRRLLEMEEAKRRESWKHKDEELVRRSRELDRLTEDLEADRVIWYRRRDELEQEFERGQAALKKNSSRGSDLDARERELKRFQEELSNLRERLIREYQERRDELARDREELKTTRAIFQVERTAALEEIEQSRQKLQRESEEQRQSLETEAREQREQLRKGLLESRTEFDQSLAELRRHFEIEAQARARKQVEELDLLRASANDVLARAKAEAAATRQELQAERAGHRKAIEAEIEAIELRRSVVEEQEKQATLDSQALARQRELFVADRELLENAQRTFETGRIAEAEKLRQREHSLEEKAADARQREEQLQRDRQTLDHDRAVFQENLVRLDRRTVAVEEKERAADERMRDVNVRLEQLERDAAEWEETIRLATEEQERLRAEAERLDRQRADLDVQSATLAERAGQLEAQQAVLAMLRAKLDRTRQEAEREAMQLSIARTREDEAFAELRTRIREAEELRAELNTVQENTAQERSRLEERDSLLAAGLEEIRQQREMLTSEAARLRDRETELDLRAAEFAEQAGTLKGRMTQALDLQTRLEADRVALREREAALAQAEDARQTLQEQLRRRAEDLAARARALDEVARQLAADRAAIDQARSRIEIERQIAAGDDAERRRQLEARAHELEKLSAEQAEREQALARQSAALEEANAAIAAERESLVGSRERWEKDRNAALRADRISREELAAFRAQATAEIERLRQQAPELESQAGAALERLAAARETLRNHLSELHDFARLSREDLAGISQQVRQEADRLREQEESLNRARAEHRLSATAFRQQLIEWQGQVAEMKRTLSSSETRLDARQAAVDQAAKQVDATTQQLAEQAEQLRLEREAVSARRGEVERHLAEMREWYRKKLRELASERAERAAISAATDSPLDKPRLARFDDSDASNDSTPEASSRSSLDELDPGDRQLGELLRSHGLVDGETLTALWNEAGRQRRTLRQVLLASGAITLYQLALIEAGNLDALMLDRFRVIDRLRATPREVIYRVFDPTDRNRGESGRTMGSQPGVFMLRHLSEAELHDAVHPDEYRQRFAAARDAAHPNLTAVLEVLEINGRPAVLQEWLTGLFSADWPAHGAHPGCWVRLATMAASGIEAAHRHGLVHGRLTSDSFVLTAAGVLKVAGFGEPPWLLPVPLPGDMSAAADLRTFGQVIYGWSQLAAKRKGTTKPKQFPDALQAVIRRLEADPEPPMADTVAAERPYESAAELLADLHRLARETSFSDDAWDKLLKFVAENAPDAAGGLKRSA